nr:MAG TPA: hypothetical protein [Caudoviricetes sp.]
MRDIDQNYSNSFPPPFSRPIFGAAFFISRR